MTPASTTITSCKTAINVITHHFMFGGWKEGEEEVVKRGRSLVDVEGV